MKKFAISSKEKAELFVFYFKWCIAGILVGLVLGLIASSFHYAVDIGAEIFMHHSFMIYLMPFAGIIIALLYKVCHMEKDMGTNSAIVSIREGETIKLRTAPLIYVSSVLTHLTGGSSGREGAALQLGSSIGAYMGRLMKMDHHDLKIIVMCGMSASFSALFGTPVTAAIFSIEMVGVGIMHYSSLVACMFSSVTGYIVAGAMGIAPTRFIIPVIPQLTAASIFKTIILSVMTAIVSMLFCYAMHLASKFYKKIENTLVRAFIGGVIVMAITLLMGTRAYNGAGMSGIIDAINGEARPEAFIIKIILTALTLGAGFKGGEIVPSFFTGATFGCLCASIIGLEPGFGAAIGLVAIFCGVTNCPIASVFLALELYGDAGIIFFALSCATSFVLSGYTGLYSEQKIVYSKTKPVLINKKTN